MDPGLNPSQSASPVDSSQGDDGASYLRRLKGQPTNNVAGDTADAGASAGAGCAQPSLDKPAPGFQERRRSPRFGCSGSVELFAEGSNVPMRGMLTDISLHGCYTEMSTTLPVDTKVALVVDALGFRVRTQATVRATYPFLGMGMCFAEMEPPEQVHLKQIIAALAGQRAIAKDISKPTVTAENPTAPEPRA